MQNKINDHKINYHPLLTNCHYNGNLVKNFMVNLVIQKHLSDKAKNPNLAQSERLELDEKFQQLKSQNFDILTKGDISANNYNDFHAGADQHFINCQINKVGTEFTLDEIFYLTYFAKGDLARGQHSEGPTPYSYPLNEAETTYALGNIGDCLISPLLPTNSSSTGIDLSNITNPHFIGGMPKFSVAYIGDNLVNIHALVGGVTYFANFVDTLTEGSNNLITFKSDDTGENFSIQLQEGHGLQVHNHEDARIFSTRLDRALSGIDVYQKWPVNGYQPIGSVYFDEGLRGDFAGSKFWIISNNFTDLKIEDVAVKAPDTSLPESSAEIIFKINGEEYKSGYQYDGYKLNLADLQIPNSFIKDDVNTSHLDSKYGFVNQQDPNKILIFQYNSEIPYNITNQKAASELEKIFEYSLGVTDARYESKKRELDDKFLMIKSANIFSKFEVDLTNASNAERASSVIEESILT